MQRVAQDLYRALLAHPSVEVVPLVLESTWADTHRKVVPFLLKSLLAIRRRAREESIDAILFSSMVTASLAVPLRTTLRKSQIPAAAIVHGLDVTTSFWPYQRFVPKVFDALSAVLPISRATADACFERGLARAKCTIVPNGIDVSRFDVAVTADSARTRQREKRLLLDVVSGSGNEFNSILDSDALLLTSVGRHVKRKGFAWFVAEVLPRLPSNVHYWIAGEGPETQTISSAADRAGVASRVRLVGRVSDDVLHALYRAGDVFVMPNVEVPGDMEGFGVVLLEAGLNGQPAVAAALEGILDVVQPEENGLLIESGDADGFVRAIQQLNDDRDRLATLSETSRAFVRRRFSWPSVADRYVDALRQLTDPG